MAANALCYLSHAEPVLSLRIALWAVEKERGRERKSQGKREGA
jgi:hypothetical protein